MKVKSVLSVKFPLNIEDASPILETMEKFRIACNYVSEQVSYMGNDENPVKPKYMDLYEKYYRFLCDELDLKSQMAQSVLRQVVDNYKTFNTQIEESKLEVERWQKRKAEAEAAGRRYGKRKPKVIKWHAIVYHKPFCRQTYQRTWRVLKDETFSIGTLGECVQCTVNWKGREQYRDCEFGELTLSLDKGRLYASVAVKHKIDVTNTEDVDLNKARVIGVDLGQRNLYVAYDGEKTIFCDGGLVKNKRVHAAEKRSELQRKGTPSSKRRLVALAKSENCYVELVNHTITKALIDSAKPGDVLVLEDLSGLNKTIWVRKGQRYLHYSWSFWSIRQKLEYKAREKGVVVVFVSPENTSNTCPVCGTVREANRNRNKHEYKCDCGYRGNDDSTAAMNIRQRGIDKIRRMQSVEGKPKGAGATS